MGGGLFLMNEVPLYTLNPHLRLIVFDDEPLSHHAACESLVQSTNLD